MTAWIIEDEPPALRRLTKLLAEVRPQLSIAFSTDSIASCVRALQSMPHPDVIFSDIHLADGLAFSIWETTPCLCPIVFTTAYDQYGIRAFRVNGIDYLLKPIETADLERALDKLNRLSHPPLQQDWRRIAALIEGRQPSYRERFLAQKGSEWLPVRVENLRQIYSSDGLTFALTETGQRLILDDTLDRIVEELDPKDWFRINRAQIVHASSIRKIQPYFNHRLVLELSPKGENENIVSRQRVKACKEWMGA
ncbi:LytR/AlgR family response regulator transcription factor [Neolewinella agarilytica]|uniref:Two component transcriptional regulator, LytTR family n=1 Tax=Neolewinella agarilytica TaxID=478744 RepID=A0A1H9NJW9_9BACT|nr:LytTR family DNA-binding domain-containing protein [Neolewinella agarilytica]SER35693.1 two component transcriptional regulator, LytTR family [Neolewinella agarilytica]